MGGWGGRIFVGAASAIPGVAMYSGGTATTSAIPVLRRNGKQGRKFGIEATFLRMVYMFQRSPWTSG
jgi:fructose-bisphosphate aldolase class 1